MTNIKEALKKARGKRQAAPRGRAIVEVRGLDKANNIVAAKILVGQGAGEEVKIRLNQDHDERQHTVASLMSGKAQVDLPKRGKPGGTLQVEGLVRKDGNDFYDARWVKTFQSKVNDGQTAHLGGMFRLNPFVNQDTGKRWASLSIIDVENETFAQTSEQMKAAMIEAFDTHGGVTIAAVTDDGEPVESIYVIRTDRKKRDVRKSAEDGLDDFLTELDVEDIDGAFGHVFEAGGAVTIVSSEGEAAVRNADEMEKALLKAFDLDGKATIDSVDEKGKPTKIEYQVKMTTEEYTVRQAGADRFEEFEKNLGVSLDDAFGETLSSTGISIVPTRSVRVGSGTWAAVEKKVEEQGRGGPVDPSMFAVTGLAGRLAGAYNRLENNADKAAVKQAFLRSANTDATEKFHAKGFAGVAERDVEAFLKGAGVNLIKLPNPARDGGPARGYVAGGFLTLPFDREKPETSDVMVTKAFATTAAMPMPPVKAFEDLRKAYYEEMSVALKGIAEAELSNGAPAKTEAATGEAATKEAETAAAAPKEDAPATGALSESEIEDMDALLADMDDRIDP